MNKTLTISIAAYNVEEYIGTALESLCDPRIVDELEVFVVDDGGQDATLSIARTFEEQYPQTVHAIHKENGGYGSTVNYSLAHASGTFFKLLDGDDWFDTNGLVELVATLGNTEADIVTTNYSFGPDADSLATIDYFTAEGPDPKALAGFVPKTHQGMWSMTVRTNILRQIGLHLPEHELYTDQYFCTLPLMAAQTIQYLDCTVYCYRTDRDGQSTTKEARLKHSDTALDHAAVLATFAAEQRDNPNYPIILQRVAAYHSSTIGLLLLKPINADDLREIKEYEQLIRTISEDVYAYAESIGQKGKLLGILRKTRYALYWLLGPFQSRLP